MLNWLWKRRMTDLAPRPDRELDEHVRVSHDRESITLSRDDGSAEILLWSELVSVTVLTTDEGPFAQDLFWVLRSRDGRKSLVVPMNARGEHDLLHAMQERLEGFDNMTVVEAMGSTEKASFTVWEAGKKPPPQ